MAEQRPITARDVKSNVEGYANMGDEAFARRFFADRAALQTSLHLLEGQFAYAEPLRLALQNLALGRADARLDPGPKTATVELLGSRYTPEVATRLAKLEQAISKQRTVRFTYWTIQ